jgi:AraC-like DNA-binding protein
MDAGFFFDIARLDPEETLFRFEDRWQIALLTSGAVGYRRRRGLSLFESPGLLFIPCQSGNSPRSPDDREFAADDRRSIAGYRLLVGDSIVNEMRLRARSADLFPPAAREAFFIELPNSQVGRFTALFEDTLIEWKEKSSGYRELILLKLSELFIGAVRARTTAAAAVDVAPNAKRIEEIVRHLEGRFMESLTLPELAAQLGYSPSYLSRFFKNATGSCLFEFVNRLRIQRACLLLKNTTTLVTDIAMDCGYNNISFFNRMFRRLMHCSPLEYRRRMG